MSQYDLSKLKREDWEELRKAYKLLDIFLKKNFHEREIPIYDLIVKIRRVFKN